MIEALLLALAAASAADNPSSRDVQPAAAAVDVATIRVSPETLEIRTFFDGATLEVAGVAPAGMHLAVLLHGPETAVDLVTKGKVWGFLWMNVGERRFETVPSVYLLAADGDICEMAPYDSRERLGLGLDVLGASTGAAIDDDSRRLFDEMVKLKQGESLYGSRRDAVMLEPVGPQEVAYTTSFDIPARMPEGSYEVSLWGGHDGVAAELAGAGFEVKEVGFTHDIAALAREHGLLYGLLALGIALVTGFATGLVFGLGGKGGH